MSNRDLSQLVVNSSTAGDERLRPGVVQIHVEQLMIEGTAKFVNACKNEQQVSAFSRNRIKTGFGFLNDTFLFHPLHFDASVRFGFGSDQRHKIKLFRSFLLEMKFSV